MKINQCTAGTENLEASGGNLSRGSAFCVGGEWPFRTHETRSERLIQPDVSTLRGTGSLELPPEPLHCQHCLGNICMILGGGRGLTQMFFHLAHISEKKHKLVQIRAHCPDDHGQKALVIIKTKTNEWPGNANVSLEKENLQKCGVAHWQQTAVHMRWWLLWEQKNEQGSNARTLAAKRQATGS